MTPIDLASLKRKIRLLDLDDDCAADEVSKEELEALVAVVEAARDFIQRGTKMRGFSGGEFAQVVIEHADKTDPHYKLCDALHPFSHINGEQP